MGTIKFAAAVTALSLMTASVAAQDWPTRPVTMVIPTTPGGAPDLLGRVVASRLSELLGQPVIVENVAGAGGMIGAAHVARAPADGYQFLIGTLGTQAQNPGALQIATVQRCNRFCARCFALAGPFHSDRPQGFARRPLLTNFCRYYGDRRSGSTISAPTCLNRACTAGVSRAAVAAALSLWINLQGFIAYAKANQAAMHYGSGGIGSPSHLACALFNAAVGINVTHDNRYIEQTLDRF